MAGHNKWSKVKHLKGALDQKRGKLFSKLAKEITVATKRGGGDPDSNPRLRSAVLAARAQSMPGDNIDRAIRRGTGEGAGTLEELVYEGYGRGGVALLVEVATDNKNRTAANLRLVFSKNHGNLAGGGAVAYLFQKKGTLTVPVAAIHEERMLELALEAGAEELASDDTQHVITTPADKLYAVAETLRAAGAASDSQKLTFIPATIVTVHEDSDDVQNVHTNFDAPEEVLGKISG